MEISVSLRPLKSKIGLISTALGLIFVTLSLAPSPGKALSLRSGEIKFHDGVKKKRPFDVIEINGTIAYPMAKEMEDILVKRDKKNALVIHLDTNGGAITEGMNIIKLIRQEKAEGTAVHTTVHNGQVCGSICVPIFLQGKHRYAGEIAAFMFHGVTRGVMSNIPIESKTKELLNTFIDGGVSKEWIDLMWNREAFSKPGNYWMTAKQLVEEKSGMVTKLLPAHDIAEPWEAPIDPQIRSR